MPFSFQKYEGTFVNVLKASEKSAQKLLKIIVDDFASLRDTAEFNGKTGKDFDYCIILQREK